MSETAVPSPGDGSLRGGALRTGDVIIMALASSGPTQSIAVSLAAIVATVAYAGFLPLLICFIPMLGIALGYQRLNAWQPSAGATFSWVARVLNPHLGFFAGWIMLLYYSVGTTSLTIPLGSYFLSFFSDSAANNKFAVAAVGTALNLIVLAVAVVGVQASARFQWAWAIFEYALLLGFVIAALVAIYGFHIHGSHEVTSSWFTLQGAGGVKSLVAGILLAIFLYSGWDTAAYVGEEAKGTKAGSAAIASVVILFVVYSVAILAFQGIAPLKELQDHAANILAYVGQRIGGSFWGVVMIVAVLGGTLASLQAAIVSSSRIAFAMGRERAFPRWFGRVNAKRGIPLNATILFGLLNVAFLWGSTLIDSVGQALNDVVSTLGLMAAIFYLLTATTAIWCYRKTIVRSARDFILGGLLPGIGALFMAFVVIYSLVTGSLNGVELAFGVGLVLIGFVLSFISKGVGKSAFFRRGSGTFEDELSPEIAAPTAE
jgi:amino acid transporter